MTSRAAVGLAARTAEAPATRRVVEGRRSRGWSFRSGTLHQSCACTHRHNVWFLCCLSSQETCDFVSLLFTWHDARLDCGSSDFSDQDRVGGHQGRILHTVIFCHIFTKKSRADIGMFLWVNQARYIQEEVPDARCHAMPLAAR